MGKKKILLIKVNALLSAKDIDKIGKELFNSINDYGVLVYDDRVTVNVVEVDGVKWEKNDGIL